MVKLMKLNGSESFISSELYRVINLHSGLFFPPNFTATAVRGGENASFQENTFKAGQYFRGAGEKMKTALFSNSCCHPCPFEIGHTEV